MKELKRAESEAKEPGMRHVVPGGLGNWGQCHKATSGKRNMAQQKDEGQDEKLSGSLGCQSTRQWDKERLE